MLRLYAFIASASGVLAAPSPAGFELHAYYTNYPGLGAPAINASGGSFWIHKPTQSYCPDSVANITTCPLGNGTSFVAGGQAGTLFMNTEVPGGQQVYVAPNGLLKYTVPHSGNIPEGSLTTGLIVNATTAQLNRYYTFWMCNLPEDSNVWQVWLQYEDEKGSIRIGGQGDKNACTRFVLISEPVQGIGAWEYL
ncbi:hypothetical protein BT63DRAFT_369266 [Microthyrium microscopicum]|uniref:IgE-binding protein n=1 Tax=Microthyrium microscopicum TaxID=703497 RepID=A0A6A6UH05_9PEZI|nr:hypothetical protein BT63DRAFT_369266 [Microthyrium microscopicum]